MDNSKTEGRGTPIYDSSRSIDTFPMVSITSSTGSSYESPLANAIVPGNRVDTANSSSMESAHDRSLAKSVCKSHNHTATEEYSSIPDTTRSSTHTTVRNEREDHHSANPTASEPTRRLSGDSSIHHGHHQPTSDARSTSSVQLPPAIPSSWLARSLRSISKKLTAQITYGVLTLGVAMFSAAAAAYFAYESYVIQKWQADNDFYSTCMTIVAGFPNSPQFDDCHKMLETPAPAPPYPSHMKMRRASQKVRRDAQYLNSNQSAAFLNASNMGVIILIAFSMAIIQLSLAVLWQWLIDEHRHVGSLYTQFQSSQQHASQTRNLSYGVGYAVRAEPHQSDHVSSSRRVRDSQERHKSRSLSQDSTISREPNLRTMYSNHTKPTFEFNDETATTSTIHDGAVSPQQRRLDESREHQEGSVPLSGPDEADAPAHSTSKEYHGLRSISATTRRLFSRRTVAPQISVEKHDSSAEWNVDTNVPIRDCDLSEEIPDHGDSSGHVASSLASMGKLLASSASGVIGKYMILEMTEDRSDLLHNIISSGEPKVMNEGDTRYEEEREEFIYGKHTETNHDVRRRRGTRLFKQDLD